MTLYNTKEDYTTLHNVRQHYTRLCKAIQYYTMLIIQDYTTEESIVSYICHDGGKYRAKALRRLTSNYRLTEIQISSIF